MAGSQRSFFTQPSVRFLGRPAEGIIFPGGFGAGARQPCRSRRVNSVLAGYPGTKKPENLPGSGFAYNGAIGVNTDQSLYTSANAGSCAQNYKGVGAELGAIIQPNCTTAGVVLGNYFAVQVPLTKYNFFCSKADYEIQLAYHRLRSVQSSPDLDRAGSDQPPAAPRPPPPHLRC